MGLFECIKLQNIQKYSIKYTRILIICKNNLKIIKTGINANILYLVNIFWVYYIYLLYLLFEHIMLKFYIQIIINYYKKIY